MILNSSSAPPFLNKSDLFGGRRQAFAPPAEADLHRPCRRVSGCLGNRAAITTPSGEAMSLTEIASQVYGNQRDTDQAVLQAWRSIEDEESIPGGIREAFFGAARRVVGSAKSGTPPSRDGAPSDAVSAPPQQAAGEIAGTAKRSRLPETTPKPSADQRYHAELGELRRLLGKKTDRGVRFAKACSVWFPMPACCTQIPVSFRLLLSTRAWWPRLPPSRLLHLPGRGMQIPKTIPFKPSGWSVLGASGRRWGANPSRK